MRKYKTEYALYKGDEFIDLGTADYLANKLKVKEKTIYYYQTKRWFKKSKMNSYILIKIEEDDENEIRKQ